PAGVEPGGRRGYRPAQAPGGLFGPGQGGIDLPRGRISAPAGDSGRRGNRKLTLLPHSGCDTSGPPARATHYFDRVGRQFGASGEYPVDEVTRDPHPPEEISGRREAAQGRAD